jgi:hypothetical protein
MATPELPRNQSSETSNDPEILVDHGGGAWSVGDLLITGEDMRAGLMIFGEAPDGTEVQVSLKPQECLAILSLLAAHQVELQDGAQMYGNVQDNTPSVFVTHGEGPEPIPKNPHSKRSTQS